MNRTTSRLFPALCWILILSCGVFSAGCTTTPTQSTGSLASIGTTVTTVAPVVTAATATPAQTQIQLAKANLADGVSVSYPADWQKEEISELALRDYGRTTLNIANFYSPDISSGQQDPDGTNPDTSAYTTLSIDVDPNTVTDFEQYFNLVTLALQKSYGSITITKHNYQLKISGYDSYQMDFDTKTMRGSYIFTDVDGTIYIFAFKNPSLNSLEVENMYKSVVITPTITTTKHR